MLVTSLLGNTGLDSVEHRACAGKAGTDARKDKVEREAEAVKLMQEGSPKKAKKRLGGLGSAASIFS